MPGATQTSERLPWYRAPGYSGNLTEAEKRELDGAGPSKSIWSYLVGLALMILPWVVYRYDWRKNAEANHFSSENILMEWELHHLANAKLAAKHRANDPRT